MLIYLCGVPNTGKTTLFNALTGARETVGNRAGVTVGIAKRRMKNGNVLADLPGIGSLSRGTKEERIAREAIESDPPDRLLEVIDATNPVRGLALFSWLRSFDVPIVVALNCMDEAGRLGISIDVQKLSKRLNCPVVPISARKREGLNGLEGALETAQPGAGERREPPSARERIRFAEAIADQCFTPGRERRSADGALASRFLGIPLFFLLLGALFWLAFDGVGPWLSDGVAALFNLLGAWAGTLPLPAWASDLLQNGVIGGVGQMLTFLPQIVLLLGGLSLGEDVGYLSRVAFLFDRAFSRFGLNGKAVIPLLLGFGCTVPAALCTRTLEGRGERRRVLRLLPMVPCSAKLPVLALLTAQAFPKHRMAALLLLYMFSLAAALPAALLPKGKGSEPLLLELPPYRLPSAKNTVLLLGERAGHFLFRAGTVILLCQIALWGLSHLTPSLAYCDAPTESLLFFVGGRLSPLVAPLGFSEVGAVMALLNGMLAKEAAAAALSLFSVRFTTAGALGFCVFLLLAPPCAAALSASGREYGKGYGWAVLLQLLYAYALAALVSGVARLLT